MGDKRFPGESALEALFGAIKSSLSSKQNQTLSTTIAGSSTVEGALQALEQSYSGLDYSELDNKPQINGVELSGNKTASDLGITIPANLSDLNDDSTHRLVTDTEKSAWNGKADTADIPTALSDLTDDATHRLVTDTEKSTWNGVSLKTAAGNPITIIDAANANAEELSMAIEPTQSGSGDPSPTNVRPISGISEAVVTRTGENLIDESALIAAVLDPTTGQPSASTNVKITPMISIKPSANYLFANQNGDAFRIFAYAADGTFIERTDIYWGDAVVTTGATWAYVRIQSSGAAWIATDPVLAQTVDITITLGQTVYGGSVNFKTGEVTVTHAVVDLGTLEWFKQDISTRWRFYAVLDSFKKVDVNELCGFICSTYIEKTASQTYSGYTGISGNGLTSDTICVCDLSYTDAAAFKTAMSGVQLCYELETPVTLTLTPAELELLKGNNTITANGAEISIEYYPDNAIGALAGKIGDVQEQIATKRPISVSSSVIGSAVNVANATLTNPYITPHEGFVRFDGPSCLCVNTYRMMRSSANGDIKGMWLPKGVSIYFTDGTPPIAQWFNCSNE